MTKTTKRILEINEPFIPKSSREAAKKTREKIYREIGRKK